MPVAIMMTVSVIAVIVFAAVAPAVVSWADASGQQDRFNTEYDRMIAEFARRRRAESVLGVQELPTGRLTGRAVTNAPRLDHGRSRVNGPAALRRR